MNLLVTGGTGFIGRCLLKLAAERFPSWNIFSLSSRPTGFGTCIDHKNYHFTKDSLMSEGLIEIDVLIHLGAYTPKCSQEANEIEPSISNINNTLYLLNHLPSIPKKVIFASTLDVYSNVSGPISETTPTIPESLYGQSKLFGEKVVSLWASSHGAISQILRIGHIYGEGEDQYKKVIPSTIKKLIQNEPPVIYSDGSEKRSFLYIRDCCQFILNSILLEEYAGPINLASEHSVSLNYLIDKLIQVSSKNIRPEVFGNNIKTRDFIFDNRKRIELLGEEKTTLDQGLAAEYQYFKDKH